jgi:hypothetical protein
VPFSDAGAYIFRCTESCVYRYFDISYYPWTDMSENVYLGFLVAHGAKLFDLAVFNHMPGVPQFLAIFLWAFGFDNALPGSSTATAAWLTASFATVLFQVACLYCVLRWLAYSPALSAWISLVVCAYTAFAFDFALPMSETLIPYLLVAVPPLLYVISFGSPAERTIAAVWLGGPVTLVCLNLGLTVAPMNALLGLFSAAVLILGLRSDAHVVLQTICGDWRCHIAYLFMLLLICAWWLTVDVNNAYFWAVEVNRTQLIDPWNSIITSFKAHATTFGREEGPLGSRYPEFLCLLVVLLATTFHLQQRNQDRTAVIGRLACFAAVLIMSTILTQWRFSSGYKSSTIFGLSLGILLLIFARLPVGARSRQLSNLALIPIFVVAIVQTAFLNGATTYESQPQVRTQALDAAKVCRLSQQLECRCIQATTFGPQWFLLNDVRPCRNRYGTMPPLLGMYPVTRQWVIDDASDSDVAFLARLSKASMLENNIPAEAIRIWQTSAKCLSYDPQFQVCFFDPTRAPPATPQ